MSDFIEPVAEWSAAIIEVIGIAAIVAASAWALLMGLRGLLRGEDGDATFQKVRLRLGRGILLGLEFLVAADIIHTVAVELTFRSVGVLAIIVLIRTFLSATLEAEMTGRLPWQRRHPPAAPDRA